MTRRQPPTEELKKLYAGKDKVRFEVETGNAGTGPAAVILDWAQNKYTVVMSERRMYTDDDDDG